MKEIDQFYLRQQEPAKSCLLALRQIIPAYDEHVTEAWKYNMPFFCYNGKMFCYLWVEPKSGHPYFGIVEGKRINHPKLITGTRSRMKIMMLDPAKDIPIRSLDQIFKLTLDLYRKGVIKTKNPVIALSNKGRE